ncbi:MAG: hypothetical protein ACRD2C_24075 [Acidimicrobiales bacterium]
MAVGSTLLAGACGGSGDADGNAADDAETATAAPDPTGAEGAAGTPSAGGPDGRADPCDLLNGVDAEILLGEPASEPQAEGTVCRVVPADTGSRGQFGLVVETERPEDNFETQQEVFGIDTEVTGLGDAAFHSGSYLFVLDGDTFFFLQVLRDEAQGGGVSDSDLEDAARTVVANLDR